MFSWIDQRQLGYPNTKTGLFKSFKSVVLSIKKYLYSEIFFYFIKDLDVQIVYNIIKLDKVNNLRQRGQAQARTWVQLLFCSHFLIDFQILFESVLSCLVSTNPETFKHQWCLVVGGFHPPIMFTPVKVHLNIIKLDKVKNLKLLRGQDQAQTRVQLLFCSHFLIDFPILFESVSSWFRPSRLVSTNPETSKHQWWLVVSGFHPPITFTPVKVHLTLHSCTMTMNKMSLAVVHLHTLLVYIEMQTDLWLDQFMLSVHTSTI